MNAHNDRFNGRPAFIVLSRMDIAALAYERYVQGGRVDGNADDDWRCAEQELRTLGQNAARRVRGSAAPPVSA